MQPHLDWLWENHPVISPDETIDLEELDIIIYNLLSICKFYQ